MPVRIEQHVLAFTTRHARGRGRSKRFVVEGVTQKEATK